MDCGLLILAPLTRAIIKSRSLGLGVGGADVQFRCGFRSIIHASNAECAVTSLGYLVAVADAGCDGVVLSVAEEFLVASA